MQHEVAGDPITGLKWTRKTVDKIAAQLVRLGIHISNNTVAKLLKKMDFSLRVNKKIVACGARTDPRSQAERNEQFNYINKLRDQFAKKGKPVISVDTKKKELIGNFKQPGATWDKVARCVNDHDYPSDALGKATPYGIYDTIANKGMVNIGSSHDTAVFAVDSLILWWKKIGNKRYHSDEILILADSGGSNSASSRLFKYRLQKSFCERYGLKVTVCHYPAGTSKWNPIEHRLFSEISKNWAGEPLDSFEKVLKFIKTTKTATGLEVEGFLSNQIYETGIKVSDEKMKTIKIKKHKKFPKLNYTLSC
jgi:hypothetical protein